MDQPIEVSTVQDCKAVVRDTGWAWISPCTGIDLGALAYALGSVIPPRTGGVDRKLLRPYISAEAPPYSMSAFTGTDAQPMHTDCAYIPRPPRYVILACITPGEAECRTRLWALNWDVVLARPHNLLSRPGWIVRGGGRQGAFYAQVLNRTAERELFIRFDPCCMTPPDNAKAATKEVSSVLEQCATPAEVSWVRGAALLIDNWRCLHARGEGAEHAPGRLLERWLIGDNNGMVTANAL